MIDPVGYKIKIPIFRALGRMINLNSNCSWSSWKKNDSHLSPIIFFILYYKIFSEVGKASSVDKLKNLAIIVNKENFFFWRDYLCFHDNNLLLCQKMMIMFRRFEIRKYYSLKKNKKNVCYSDHNTCSEINFPIFLE